MPNDLSQSPHYKWWVLAVVQCSILLVGLDSTIVNLALPTITRHFHSSVHLSQWVVSAYFITTALALPAAGRLADMLGRKTVFVGGFAVFTIGSVLCGLAPSVEALIAMRVLQAIGGAALLANSNVITLAVFPFEQHGMAMGVNGTVFALGYALGYTLGGYFIHALGWRSIFLVNLPIGILAILLGLFVLVEARITPGKKSGQVFDYTGAIFSVLAIGGLMVSLEGWVTEGQLGGINLMLLMIGVASMALFIAAELRNPSPMLDVRLFRLPLFSIGTSTRLLYNGIVASCAFVIPFYTQLALGYTPLQSGMIMLPYSMALAVCGPLAGRLSDRFGSRLMTTGSFVSGCLALLWLSTLKAAGPGSTADDTLFKVIAGMFFLGGTSGFFVSPNNSITLDSVPPSATGSASGCLWCVGFLGSALGTAFSAAMLHHGLSDAGGKAALQEKLHGALDPVVAASLLHAQTQVFYILLIFSAAGGILCFMRGSGPHKKKTT